MTCDKLFARCMKLARGVIGYDIFNSVMADMLLAFHHTIGVEVEKYTIKELDEDDEYIILKLSKNETLQNYLGTQKIAYNTLEYDVLVEMQGNIIYVKIKK